MSQLCEFWREVLLCVCLFVLLILCVFSHSWGEDVSLNTSIRTYVSEAELNAHAAKWRGITALTAKSLKCDSPAKAGPLRTFAFKIVANLDSWPRHMIEFRIIYPDLEVRIM